MRLRIPRRRASSAVLLGLVLVLPRGSAGAAPKPAGVLVLGLDAPHADAATVARLDGEIRAEVTALKKGKGKLLPKPALQLSDLRTAAGCVDDSPACLLLVGRTLGAAQVVGTRIQEATPLRFDITIADVVKKKTRELSAELTGIDASSGPEIRCHVARAFGIARPMPDGRLELVSAHPDMAWKDVEILLDDAPVALSALAKVKPGAHQLLIRARGFEPFSWSGVVRPGLTERITVAPYRANGSAETKPPAVVAVERDVATSPAPPEPDSVEIGRTAEAPVSSDATLLTPAPLEPIPSSANYLGPTVVGALAIVAMGAAIFGGLEVLAAEDQAAKHREGQANGTLPPGPAGGSVCDESPAPSFCARGERGQAMSFVFWPTAGVFLVASGIWFLLEHETTGDAATFGARSGTAGDALRPFSLAF